MTVIEYICLRLLPEARLMYMPFREFDVHAVSGVPFTPVFSLFLL